MLLQRFRKEGSVSEKILMSAVILAGGQSSRMGRDKALLPFGPGTLLEFLADAVSSIFCETLIVVNEKQKCAGLDLGGAGIYEDLFKNRGPLAGLYTGLSYAQHQASCVLTCDMPFLDEKVLREMASVWQEGYDVICLEDSEGIAQPFPAIYLRSCKYLISLLLERREHSMKRLFEVATVKTFTLPQETKKVLMNMNTPEDYARVRKEKKEWIKE